MNEKSAETENITAFPMSDWRGAARKDPKTKRPAERLNKNTRKSRNNCFEFKPKR